MSATGGIGTPQYSIGVYGGSVVRENICSGQPLVVHGRGNRIEGNNVVDSLDYGIHVVDPGNTIVKNSVSNSFLDDYKIVAGNDVGPIGTAATSMSPWANIVY